MLRRLVLSDEERKLIEERFCHTCYVNPPRSILEERMATNTDIHEHLATLYFFTTELNLKNVVELGTRDGESTIALLLACKKIGGRLTSIDIDPCLTAKQRIESYGLTSYWSFMQANVAKVDWHDSIDHLFVDTSHTYEQTLLELNKFEPYVTPGGVITLHDIVTYPSVLQAINDYVSERSDLGFYQYFNCHGLGVIRKRLETVLR
jgi:predicted O-methyltransferase YrrM